jgi:DNA adenine methylase
MQGRAVQTQNSRGLLHNDLPQIHPFVKWAGGKTQLLSRLDEFIPSGFNQYFEPFLGGGAMFFHLISNKNIRFTAYLSDLNGELINTYRVIQNDVERLIEVLKKNENEYKKNPSRYYYELRDYNNPLNDVERAARLITLNKTCYNGLYRVNKNGIFNVPMGKYKNPVICDSSKLKKVSSALRHSKAIIKVADYKQILFENVKGNDLVYLDPPYNPTSSTANFTYYTDYGFDNKDQEDLANIFGRLNDRKCKVLLSNSDTPFIRKLYHDFSKYTKEIDTLRSINCKGSKRVGHKELLIRNYP